MHGVSIFDSWVQILLEREHKILLDGNAAK
jgi:hypothetical protein